MDEAKKKYLEYLRKQIDPKVLEKMVQHIGGEDSESPRSVSPSAPTSLPAASSEPEPSSVAQIKKMRNDRFQNMLAQMRMEN